MFVLKRRTIVIVSVLIVTALTFILCFSALNVKSIGNAQGVVKVVLDAGHGGVDTGVSGIRTGVKESELNLKVVKKLENYLMGAGFEVVLTRNSDAGLYGMATSNRKRKDMQKRKEIIEEANPTLVVSIHMNKYSVSTRRGGQVFYKAGDDNSKKLANNIQESFNNIEQSTRSLSALNGDYYILNCTSFPSVIAECGFLSNPEEEALLITEEYQEIVAYAIFKGIVGYLAETSFVFCD